MPKQINIFDLCGNSENDMKNKIYNEERAKIDKLKTFFRAFFLGRGMRQSIKAMDIAIKHHCGKRKDGKPEVSHQFEIVSYVLQLMEHKISVQELDNLVASCFLHDVVEDYGDIYSCENLFKGFGGDIFTIVCLVTKQEGFQKIPTFLDNYYDDMLHDVYAVIVKGVDRMHNIQSMVGAFSIKKRKQYIQEVKMYFYPLLKKARKIYPDFYFVFIAIEKSLERQIFLIEEINRLEKITLNIQYGSIKEKV